MLGSLRARLSLIVGAAAVAVLASIAASALTSARQARDLHDLEQRVVPKLELGPSLQAEFDHLRQGMQDAVAAQDAAALAATIDIRNRLFERLGGARGVIEPNDAALLRWAVQDYYDTGQTVSRRMIAGETGESLIDDMARLQAQQGKVTALVKSTTGLTRAELAASFASIAAGTERADRFRIVTSSLGLLLVLGLSLSASRGVLKTLRGVSNGLTRFARGDFSEPIAGGGVEEIVRLGREANQMARALEEMALRRDQEDWLKESLVQLSSEMRGEADPSAFAERVVRRIVERTEAVAGALYVVEGNGLRLRGHYALHAPPVRVDATSGSPAAHGRGLLLEALRAEGLMLISDVPPGFATVHSGLGSAEPTSLRLLPLSRFGDAIGVLELAFFAKPPPQSDRLLAAAQEMLVIGLQAALSRAALKRALEQTQHQAERLTAQEEELRTNNQELQSQHEELRVANSELEAQRLAMSERNEELEEARRRLQQKADELSKVSTYKSQFLANMSHELRTPLNSMLLLSHLLSENELGNLNEKQVEYCKTIHSAGGDLLNLINQVLDLAKIEAGRQDLLLEDVSVLRLADYARRTFEHLAHEKQLGFAVEVAADAPETLFTDAQRVERILTNLVGNAIKFTDRGRVTLRIGRADGEARLTRTDLKPDACVALSVTDTGIGIASDAHERVFAPFEQIDSHSTRRYAGTGLGLAISRESVALLGGELQLVSEPGVGSTFTCYLPLRAPESNEKPHEAAVAASAAPRVADPRTEPVSGTPRLLIIEDDPVLAEQLVDIIHARRLSALVATTGEAGLAAALEHRPQGIILDVRLPDIDGWTVMDRLRARPETREIPVHFVSGLDSAERALALGAVGYLMKPASHSELARAVRSLTPSAPGARRILIVEDSAADGEALRAVLEREGFEATRVGSARAALDALELTRFECMILDLGLPDMDGLAVLETLRARAPGATPRVIVHTGRALNKRETQQLEAYAQAVVLKEGDSASRILEEIRLFVSHVTDGLPPQARSRIPPAPASLDVSFVGKTLLVAEDDMRTVYALSALLTSRGAEVLVADTGAEALSLLDTHPTVDAVLMDVMMPEMDGHEATRRLRRDPRFVNVPVIALTAKAMKGERERCLEAGASDYLTKPIDSEQLLKTLDSWLSGRKNGHGS